MKKGKAPKSAKKRVKWIMNRLEKEGAEGASLTEDEAVEICYRIREQLMKEESMLEVKVPIIIVGDIHGQFDDLIGIFQMNGFPQNQRYLFLGDYVDRGPYSVETAVLLFCYKLIYPTQIFLLRGNHETTIINRVYGFYDECKERYSEKLWRIFQTAFNCLPLCARVEKTIFCMHGGISAEINSWEAMAKIRRPLGIPDFGVLCDLLWSDPDSEVNGYTSSPRGVSCIFGKDAVLDFCRNMDLDMIVRGHQVVEDGYEFFANRKLITIFSAPFYCGKFDNSAAMLAVNSQLRCEFRVRKPVGHAWTRKAPKKAADKRSKKGKKSKRKRRPKNGTSKTSRSQKSSKSKRKKKTDSTSSSLKSTKSKSSRKSKNSFPNEKKAKSKSKSIVDSMMLDTSQSSKRKSRR